MLAKCIAHNLCCVVKAIFTAGLTSKEQRAVRTALRFLRMRVGAWGPLAKALRVARFAGIPMDELLAGQWLSPRMYPHCGHPPKGFADEETGVTGNEMSP